MSVEPLASVIIPNWNGLKFLAPCLDSLTKQTVEPVEVIIVDNASTDGSQALIRDRYPEVTLIELPENRGFTGACNVGMEAAQAPIVILLNNDTEVEPDWIEQVLAAFDRHPDAGSIASKMLLYDQRDTLHNAGDFYRVDGQAGNRGVWQKDGPEFQQEQAVFSACGGSSAYRRAMLDQIGLLDDAFFFLMEDVDLGWRAQLAGWQCIYAPQAVVYHHLSATGGGKTASYYAGRNTLRVIAKNYPGPLLRKYLPQIARSQFRQAFDAIKAWRGEAARARLRGMFAGLVALPGLMKQRRRIQAGRKATIDDIESILTPVEEQVS